MTNLQRVRKERGLSQSALAKKANINIRTLQHYEQRTHDINGAAAEVVIRIADALECDPHDIIEKKEAEV